MKDLWSIFLAVLRAGLWERNTRLPEHLDAEEWDRLADMAHNQAVQGLFLRGMARLPEEQLPPARLRLRLMAEVDSIARTNAQMAQVETRLLDKFFKEGMEAHVLKGSRLARFHPCPEWRSCGDIDLYVPDFARALSLFPQAKVSADGSAEMALEGVTVDLHPRYFDIHVKETLLPKVPSVTAELLMTGAHILKHAIGAGVGLKQLSDMALALDRSWGTYRPEELDLAVRRAGLARWWRLLCSLLVQDLGLNPEKCGPSFKPCSSARLMRIVRRGGNFGQNKTPRQRALQRGGWVRKASTALSFVTRLPFSLWYAPKETSSTIAELVKGNL